MDSPRPKKRSPAAVVVLVLIGSLMYVELFIQPACAPTTTGADASPQPTPDASANLDAGVTVDAGAGRIDASAPDASAPDASPPDASPPDAGRVDASLDASKPDASFSADAAL